jgi:hypothetical protein
VYVAPGATPTLSPAEADRLRSLIGKANAGPIYVAVLPATARNEAGGDSTAVAQAIGRGLGQGTVAVVVGGQFRAVSSALPRGEAGRLATEAFGAHHQDGLEPTLADFIDRVARVRRGAAPGHSGGGSGSSAGALVAVVIVLALFGGGGFLLVPRGSVR